MQGKESSPTIMDLGCTTYGSHQEYMTCLWAVLKFPKGLIEPRNTMKG